MADPIGTVKGVSKDLAAELRAEGISDSDQLLAACRTPQQRRELAGKLGVDLHMVTEVANRSDLARIKGVADVYADLLENAGVDTVRELSHRVPANLHAKLVEVNDAKALAKRLPTVGMVTDWVSQARALPPALEY